MKNKTKGQLEAEICEAVIKFEKEYMGLCVTVCPKGVLYLA